jgi:hypothetical protein
MWHIKGKIIGWYDEEGKFNWGRVTGRWHEKRGRFGFVDVELMGTKGWRKFDIGFNQVVYVRAGKVWVKINGQWRRCGR